jgi:hypothetical protein
MHHAKILLFLFYALCQELHAQECPCQLEAYIMDEDKTGTNVRDAPNGKVIKKLILKDRCSLATPIVVHKTEDGWCYMTTNDICVEKVTGWVYGGLIFASLNFHRLSLAQNKSSNGKIPPIQVFSQSSKLSPLIGKLYKEQDVSILKCCKEWVFVKALDKNGKEIRGWVEKRDLCSNPFTTCDD